MLSSVGIIAEFNPFHNGHRYLLRTARKRTGADVVVVVMSGNWVQRGIPAIVDKWRRTRMALTNGADLVIELPAQFAVQPADIFANESVKLIDQLKCRWLAFGCEDPSLNFNYLANVKLKPVHQLFHNYRYTYATLIRCNFYEQTGVRITRPNDLLALSYARAKRKLNASLILMPVRRSSIHNSSDLNPDLKFTSSTSLRRQLFESADLESIAPWLPLSCKSLMKVPWINWTTFWPLLRYRIVETSINDLSSVYQMREGLEHRFKKAAIQSVTFKQFLHEVKTKRYTYSAILRICFYVLVDLSKTDWVRVKGRPYLRILGFNRLGRAYLNQVKKSLSIPVITNVTQDALTKYLSWDFRAGMLFQMKLHRYEDLYQHPVIK